MPVFAIQNVVPATAELDPCAGKVAGDLDETMAHFALNQDLTDEASGDLLARAAQGALVALGADGVVAQDAPDAPDARRALQITAGVTRM